MDGYQLRFKVENLSAPRRYFLYLLNNFILMIIQNDDTCHLPTQDHKQLELLLQICDFIRCTKPTSINWRGKANGLSTLKNCF